MAVNVDTVGNVLKTDGVNVKQSVANVTDVGPTAAELTAIFGSPAILGRGFIGTVDDADADTTLRVFLVWTSDASWYWVAGTKAA